VLDGTELLPKGAQLSPPQFSAHVYCHQTARCIGIPPGTEVGLGPVNIVLDAPRGHSPPNFQPMSIVAKRSPISSTAEVIVNSSN